MADASAARAQAIFEFKSATLPLIAVILKTADLQLLAAALDAQLADSPDFIEQEPVVIDLSQLQAPEAGVPIDFAALRALLARHQTQPQSRCAVAPMRRTARPARPACRWRRCRWRRRAKSPAPPASPQAQWCARFRCRPAERW